MDSYTFYRKGKDLSSWQEQDLELGFFSEPKVLTAHRDNEDYFVQKSPHV